MQHIPRPAPAPPGRDFGFLHGLGCALLLLLAGLPSAGCGERAVETADAPETTREAPPPPSPVRTLDADRIYGTLAAEKPALYAAPGTPTWFLLRVDRAALVSVPFAAPDAWTDGQALDLELAAYRTHPGPVVLEVRWGDTLLGTAQSADDANGAYVPLKLQIPAARIPKGPAHLDLRDVSPPPPKRSRTDVSADRGTIWIDAIRMSIPGTPPPDRNPDAAASPSARVTLDLDALPKQLAHLILSVPELVPAARRLAAHRTAHGIPSHVLDVTTLAPDAIGIEGLTQVIARIAEARPLRYVVLAGDAAYDRTDLLPRVTIPAPSVRTMYNGPTAADAQYLPTGGTLSIGRLPFRARAELDAYVTRVIRYETTPPVHPTRRLMRFVTNEARFGAMVDNAIERLFRGVLATRVPLAYEIEVTFASAGSPFFWPPRRMNEKVISGLNEGALFFTYVGHGFQFGFDQVRVGRQWFPVLHAKHVPQVDIRGTPPVAFVIACTTAQFDDPRHDGIGEALLKRPGGPIAYWGATRICHPVPNSLVGYTLADVMAREGPPMRLGDLIRTAWEAAADRQSADAQLKQIRFFAALMAQGVDINRLVEEGRQMYALLGDPALEIAYPAQDLTLTQVEDPSGDIVVAITGNLPEGTQLEVSLEKTRDQVVHPPTPVENVLAPGAEAAIRENHRRSNDWALVRRQVPLVDGRAAERFQVTGDRSRLLVKAWTLSKRGVHQGAVRVR